MLTDWLENQPRNPNPYKGFLVADILEKEAISSHVKTYLNEMQKAEYCDLNFYRSMVKVLGWEKTHQRLVEDHIPTLERVQRGDFGEALSNAILEEFYGYSIPVRKLRYKIRGNQTLPGTDSIAIKLNAEGVITEVCFIESKLRTIPDNQVAVEAHEQLQEDYNSQLPLLLKFIAARLFDRNSPLFDPFTQYMGDRSDTRDKDTFLISLCFDLPCWNEKVLETLEDRPVDLPRLSAHAIRIINLRQLSDEVFGDLGITEVLDDD
jgi:hypothetical protein